MKETIEQSHKARWQKEDLFKQQQIIKRNDTTNLSANY